MRKYKKKESVSGCPTQLNRIIAGVNHLPLNSNELLRMLVRLNEDISENGLEEIYENSELHRERINSLNLKEEISDYLIGEMPDVIILSQVVINFSELILAKPVLEGIAEINNNEIKNRGKKPFTKTINDLYRAFLYARKILDIRFSGTLQLVDGYIRPELSGLPLVFQNENIPPERIRICPVCKNIFWAKRIDSKTCGNKKCAETLGGKTYHAENKEEITRNKRKKYYEKNKILFCPECVRPLLTCECETSSKQRSKK